MTREEAIKWVDDRMCWGRGTFTENHPPNIDECWKAGCMAIKALKSERPKGKWLKVPDRETVYACDQCGCEPYYFGDINTIKFCPNCGSRMCREDSEEE